MISSDSWGGPLGLAEGFQHGSRRIRQTRRQRYVAGTEVLIAIQALLARAMIDSDAGTRLSLDLD